MKRTLASIASGLLAVTTLIAVTPSAQARAGHPTPLTNLAHLDFLTARVAPPAQNGHTTYGLNRQPSVGVLWVYATHQDDGSFTRVGGGDYDAATNRYSQGAYDADDVARAAVVYVRHWKQFGDAHSREQAYQLLRGLTYLQTASGPNVGNVVLWMQPDGTLTPSAIPKELPDPSDSANSYWLARTIWALGEGYAQFRRSDPSFAAFLRARLDLAVGALQRDSLRQYGQYQLVDGARVPTWLIVDGADASAEATLGLSAAVTAGVGEARTPLRELAAGVADQGTAPSTSTWPYGAILPQATSRSSWHAWASLTPAALAQAAGALHERDLLGPAAADAASFSSWLLVTEGPISGLTPAPTDRSSIAYGADSRVESLLAVAVATRSPGLRALAGAYAGWYFGQNAAHRPAYDPATGVTVDGIAADGTVNENSGAESTIHGLLSMLTLDANPDVARTARAAAQLRSRDTTTVLEAESGTVTGAAASVLADPAYTGESSWSGGAYLQSTGTASVTWAAPTVDATTSVSIVVDRVPGRGATITLRADGRPVGRISTGGGGAQGASPAPGALTPVLTGTVPAGTRRLSATIDGPARLDALLLTATVPSLRTAGLTVTANRSAHPVVVAGEGSAYDRYGRIAGCARHGRLLVPSGGFAVLRP